MTVDSSHELPDPEGPPAHGEPATDETSDAPTERDPEPVIEAGQAESEAGPSSAVATSDSTLEPGASGPLSAAVGRRKIQVGTRPPLASGSDPTANPPGKQSLASKPTGPPDGSEEAAEESADQPPQELAQPVAPRAKVPPPSRRDRMTPELEQALQSAMAGASMEELLAEAAPTGSGEPLEVDSKHRGVVVKIHGDDVFFSLDGRSEAVASLRQFPEPPEVGVELDVVIRGFHAEDGLYEVTVPGGAIDVHDWSDLVEGAVVEARITGSNVGGLECMVGGIRGFIPASQIEMYRVEQYAEYYEKKLPCVVTEANKRRRNLVLSHRAFLEREKEQERKKLLEEIEVGQVREGVVSSVRDFGAFIDLGGIDGLVHISQLSWDRVGHPSEVLEVGQKVRVKVEKINPQTGKISLSYRDLLTHPWTNIEERFPVNSTVKGTVTRIAKFGAFVKIAPGVEGLIHISELAHHRVMQVSSVVKEGEEVEVKVLSVDEESQRIGLSLKAAHPLSEVGTQDETTEDEAPQEESPPRERLVKQRRGPLRGGTDRPTGGEDVGLRW